MILTRKDICSKIVINLVLHACVGCIRYVAKEIEYENLFHFVEWLCRVTGSGESSCFKAFDDSHLTKIGGLLFQRNKNKIIVEKIFGEFCILNFDQIKAFLMVTFPG
jgi:hypothetical protein